MRTSKEARLERERPLEDELKELFQRLPRLDGMELIDLQHEAEHAELIAHAKVAIVKETGEWREINRLQAAKERDNA